MDGESGIEDASASCSGTHQATRATDTADPPLSLYPEPTGQGDPEPSQELLHANTLTAILGSPLLPEPDQLKVVHITVLLAMAADGPI